MMRTPITITLLALLALSIDLQAESPFRVQPAISFDNDVEKIRLESCVRRELRKFGDVQVVDTSPDYVINMAMYKQVVTCGTLSKANYAAGTVFLNGDWYLLHGLVLFDTELERLCEIAVAEFDQEVLEKERRLARRVDDAIRKLDKARLMNVQEALAIQGYYEGHVDGIAGPRTQSAVRAFQADRSLPVTGSWRDITAAISLPEGKRIRPLREDEEVIPLPRGARAVDDTESAGGETGKK